MEKIEDSGDIARKSRPMLRPDRFARRLEAIALGELAEQGVRGLILDLDNTVVGYGRDRLMPGDELWIEQAKKAGFRMVLLSNNTTGRCRRIGAALGIDALDCALKPSPHGFHRALRVLGTARTETVVIGDQLFTDVLGARLAGVRAILVDPIEPHDFVGTRVLRALERLVMPNGRP